MANQYVNFRKGGSMSGAVFDVFTERGEFVYLITVIDFGYLYYVSSNFAFLVVAVYLLIPASRVFHHANDRGNLHLSLYPPGIKEILFFIPWILSFIVAPALLFHLTESNDLIAITLILITAWIVTWHVTHPEFKRIRSE